MFRTAIESTYNTLNNNRANFRKEMLMFVENTTILVPYYKNFPVAI